MKKIECVIMDWAGTAVDYGCFAPVAAFLKAFGEVGITVTMEEARRPMGMAKIDHIRELFKLPGVTEQFQKLYNRLWTEEDTTDNCVTPDGLPAGRPQPFMIYKNMTDLNVPSVTSVVKYGDTIADIKEGVNAGVWTVGVILGSNEMGLTQEETEKLPSDELNKRMAAVRKRMYMAGAHYVVNSIAELPEIIEIINHKIN